MLVLGDRQTLFRWHGPGLLLPDDPCNFLVRLQTREASYPEHDGYLSLKFVSGGREHYTRDRRTVSGQTVTQRMVFHDIERDSLVWDWEASRDKGKTWRLLWRLNYKRKGT